jgi:hypothetical protein
MLQRSILDTSKSNSRRNSMNFSSYSPYGVTQATNSPSPSDVRRWTRILKAKLRKIVEHIGSPFVEGRYPPF